MKKSLKSLKPLKPKRVDWKAVVNVPRHLKLASIRKRDPNRVASELAETMTARGIPMTSITVRHPETEEAYKYATDPEGRPHLTEGRFPGEDFWRVLVGGEWVRKHPEEVPPPPEPSGEE